MKIPLEWLKEYVEIHKTTKEVAEAFTLLGLLLDKPVETVNDMEVLDLEHRMDRSDWLSIIGCARDLAAFEGLQLCYPQLYTEKGKDLSENEKIKVEVMCPDLVRRFNTKIIKNVQVAESPEWLKKRLEAYGIPAKNNIVDITNYVMVEYGQPMHAQDIAKLQTNKLVFRNAREGEEITTLLGESVKLIPEAFVLTANDKPIVIGGIVGGAATGVTADTTDIFLDSGSYDQNTVRRVSRALKIQNESVLRYDKFLHPHSNEVAMHRAVQLILELAGGEYYENQDYYPNPPQPKHMQIRTARIKQLSDIDFDSRRVEEILTALEYKILEITDESLKVEIPYFRTDIEVEDDIVADVLRINSYEKIPTTPIMSPPPKEITPSTYKFEEKLRDIMVTLGGHEHITDPMTKTTGEEHQIVLENALTSEKNALRTTIAQTLRPAIATYIKHKIPEVHLFEVGKIYTKLNGDYNEKRVLQYVYANEARDYVQISQTTKETLASLFHSLGIEKKDIKYQKDPDKTYTCIYHAGTLLGVLGLDAFALHIIDLEEASGEPKRVTNVIPNNTTEDVTFEIAADATFGEKFNEILNSDGVKSAFVKGIYYNPAKPNTKTVTISILRSSA